MWSFHLGRDRGSNHQPSALATNNPVLYQWGYFRIHKNRWIDNRVAHSIVWNPLNSCSLSVVQAAAEHGDFLSRGTEFDPHTIFFYKQFDSGYRAQLLKNFGWFEGSKLLSRCLILYVFIHKNNKHNFSKENIMHWSCLFPRNLRVYRPVDFGSTETKKYNNLAYFAYFYSEQENSEHTSVTWGPCKVVPHLWPGAPSGRLRVLWPACLYKIA